MSEQMIWTLIPIIGVVLLIFVLLAMLNKFLVKSEAGKALIKTGFGSSKPGIYLSSAFVFPLLHRIDRIDLTINTVRISRRGHESLSCADGIRAEVDVDFYIKINPLEEDIRHVASTIGCQRASDINTLRELFEAKFADALKTAGAMLRFDQLYQNRRAFRDEILKALGGEGDHEVILNGYRLDDVAIQYLEQLPLELHNENNVLDSRGRKEIAQRTSAEVEAANKRLREKEVTIAEQNRSAKLQQLQIEQDIAAKEALQQREIKEAQAREQAKMQQTIAEQDKEAEQARIAKEQAVAEAEIERQKAVQLADQARMQQTEQAQIQREQAIQIADQEKQKQIEIARIERERAQAEAMKAKLKTMEEVALHDVDRLKAEEQALTAKALEIANRQKSIDIIEAEKTAAVDKEKQQVEFDVKAYEIMRVAEAKLKAAELDAQAAERQAKAIEIVGNAQVANLRTTLEAQNVINDKAILAASLEKLVPLLPELIEKLMKPAEKIESIKVLNIGGMNGNGANGDASNNNSMMGGILNTVLNAGMLMPVLKEVMGMMQQNGQMPELMKLLQQIPGGEQLLATTKAEIAEEVTETKN